MRTVTAGLVTAVAAGTLGVCVMQGAALAQGAPSSPSAGDGGAAVGMKIADFLDRLRPEKDSSTASNSSTPGASY